MPTGGAPWSEQPLFFAILFALSLVFFFLPQAAFASDWSGLAESAPLALLAVLLSLAVHRKLAPAGYRRAGALGRRLAAALLFLAGLLGVEIAAFYLVLTLPGAAAASRFPLSSLSSIYAASGPALRPHVLHLAGHFADSSALAAGFCIVLMALASGPVWTGHGWGWKAALAAGAVPALGLTAALLSYPTDHPYFAVLPMAWLAGTLSSWIADRKAGRHAP